MTLYKDLSFWALLVVNLAPILLTLGKGWSVGTVIWIYWSQSLTIGILWSLKIIMLKNFSTQDMEINDKPVDPTPATKRRIFLEFVYGYSFVHILYSILLRVNIKNANISNILPMALLFFIYQCFSFTYNKKWKTQGKPNIGNLLIFPFLRAIPIHLTVMLGPLIAWLDNIAGLIFFMTLKTIADLFMHNFEKKGFDDKVILEQNDS